MLILRNFSKLPNRVETTYQKLHFVSFAQIAKEFFLNVKIKVLKEKIQDIELHWIVYHLFDKLLK